MIREETDEGDNGTVNASVTYGYDASGNRILIENDNDNNGQVDSRSEFTFNGAGQMLAGFIDHEADGQVDSYVSYGYDSLGCLRWASDGSQAQRTVIDSQGNELLEFMSDADGCDIQMSISNHYLYF